MLVIEDLLRAFERGDVSQMNALTTDDLNLRIEHYHDEVDVSWQRSTDRGEFHALLERLSKDVFPRGTRILSMRTQPLADGWSITELHHKFFYAVRAREVLGRTWIVAHENGGRCDYFRETVATIEDA